MIRALFLGALVMLAQTSRAAETRRLAFERGTDVWLANFDGSDAKKIARGMGPDLSPDGKLLAFHTDSGDQKTLERRIAVADLASGKVSIFKKEIPSDNCQHAVFSPDGSQIVFNLYTDADWHLGLINADGSGFRYLKKAPAKNISFWSACWAPDGKSVYVQDLDKLSQLSLEGAELKKWDLHALFPAGGLTSSSRLAVSPDGATLLLDVEMDEDVDREDWEDPVPSIWTLDLASEKVTRLTPKDFFGWNGFWLSNDEVLFVSQGEEEETPSLYRMSRQGDNPKVFLKNANAPSVSR
jgi:TolB protein